MDGVAAVLMHGVSVYRGYVDDPRNTDNAWMETVCSLHANSEPRCAQEALLFHDESGAASTLPLHAGDDAVNVRCAFLLHSRIMMGFRWRGWSMCPAWRCMPAMASLFVAPPSSCGAHLTCSPPECHVEHNQSRSTA